MARSAVSKVERWYRSREVRGAGIVSKVAEGGRSGGREKSS